MFGSPHSRSKEVVSSVDSRTGHGHTLVEGPMPRLEPVVRREVFAEANGRGLQADERRTIESSGASLGGRSPAVL